MKGQVQRRFTRWRVGYGAKVRVDDATIPLSCQVEDLSLKGIRLALGIKLAENRPLKLLIDFADDFVLEVEAWVAWHKMAADFHSYGLFFTRINDAMKDKIYHFIQRYFSEEATRRLQGEAEEKDRLVMEDRRIFERFPVNLSLRYINLDSKQEGTAQTHDISAKGLRLITHEELRPNTSLELWLQTPDRSEPFYTRGEVTWSESAGPDTCCAGINLERIDFMGISRLLKF
jgi:hypothetical protein